jgi:hypothetical protein
MEAWLPELLWIRILTIYRDSKEFERKKVQYFMIFNGLGTSHVICQHILFNGQKMSRQDQNPEPDLAGSVINWPLWIRTGKAGYGYERNIYGSLTPFTDTLWQGGFGSTCLYTDLEPLNQLDPELVSKFPSASFC